MPMVLLACSCLACPAPQVGLRREETAACADDGTPMAGLEAQGYYNAAAHGHAAPTSGAQAQATRGSAHGLDSVVGEWVELAMGQVT